VQKIYDISETGESDHQRTIWALISTRLPFGVPKCDGVEYMNPAGGGDISLLSTICYQMPKESKFKCQT